MQLSSVYLYEKIKEKYEITERGTLSGSDGYLRPFLCYEKKETFRQGHVYVVQRCAKEWEPAVLTAENIFWVFCGREKIDAERGSLFRSSNRYSPSFYCREFLQSRRGVGYAL